MIPPAPTAPLAALGVADPRGPGHVGHPPASERARFSALLATQVGAQQSGGPASWSTVTLGEMIHGPAGGVAVAATSAGPNVFGSAVPTDPSGSAVVDAASAYLGVPYRWGGTDPATGLDCSGLVQKVFADLGVSLPRVSADQARSGVAVPSLTEARPGDLVYWAGRDGRPNHIGIYTGNGQMLHAPRTGDVVRVGSVRTAAPDAIRRIV